MTEEFKEIAQRCVQGDLSAMQWMAEYFKRDIQEAILVNADKVVEEYDSKQAISMIKESLKNVPDLLFKIRSAGFWLNRAAFYGDKEALETLSLHPSFEVLGMIPQKFYYGEKNMSISCSKDIMMQMGILTITDPSGFTLHSLDENRFFKTVSYAGCEGPDEDGYGMEEEYNFTFYDEFFDPLLELHGWSNNDLKTSWDNRLLKECLAKKKEYAAKREHYWKDKNLKDKYHVPYGCIIENGVVTEYIGDSDKDCIIPDYATEIGNAAFMNCKSLHHVKLPSSLEKIGSGAFYGSSIESFEWPANIKEIPAKAFWHCHDLKHITIPDGITKIGYQAFWGCWNLEEINLPSSLKEIEQGAFRYCEKIKTIHWPKGIERIPAECFAGCMALENINMEGVHKIETDAFSGCRSLKEMPSSASLSAIEKGAFRYCDGFIKVQWPEHVSTIAENTFSECRNLKEIIVPSSVSIDPKAFDRCSHVKIKKR